MGDISLFLREVGLRLRMERERLELSQAELGQAGGVNRNSQAEYEAGKRPFTIAYLAAAEAAGLDLGFVVSGARNVEQMTSEELELLTCNAAIDQEAQAGLLTVAQSMAGRLRQRQLHSPVLHYQPEGDALPPTPALADAFEAVLLASPRMERAELAHELAKRLPTLLRVAGGATPDQGRQDVAAEPDPARSAGRPGSQQAQRT